MHQSAYVRPEHIISAYLQYQVAGLATGVFAAAHVMQVGHAHIPAFGGRASYKGTLIDGGVAANNPTLLGLAFMQKHGVMLKLHFLPVCKVTGIAIIMTGDFIK